MTKIEELEQKLNECQKELAELKESKKEGKWKPKKGDEIWFRNMTGKVSYLYYQEGINIKSNLVFPTKEACERYWHFVDAVKEKSYEFSVSDWNTTKERKYFIRYDYENDYWKVDYTFIVRDLGKIYFKTEEDAQYIIDNFKDELMEFFVERG